MSSDHSRRVRTSFREDLTADGLLPRGCLRISTVLKKSTRSMYTYITRLFADPVGAHEPRRCSVFREIRHEGPVGYSAGFIVQNTGTPAIRHNERALRIQFASGETLCSPPDETSGMMWAYGSTLAMTGGWNDWHTGAYLLNDVDRVLRRRRGERKRILRVVGLALVSGCQEATFRDLSNHGMSA